MVIGTNSDLFKGMKGAALVAATTVLLAGCSGGSSDSTAVSPPPPPPGGGGTTLNGNGGLWAGTVTSGPLAGKCMEGIYAKSGASKFWLYDGVAGDCSQGHGVSGILVAPSDLTVTGDNYTGPYASYGNGVILPNGGATETGTMSGAVSESDGSIAGSYTDGASDSGNYALAFDSTYNTPVDLLTNGANGAYQFTYSVNGSQVGGLMQLNQDATDTKTDDITGTDGNGCTYTGTITIDDSRFNAYDVSLTVTCAGSSVALSGLATYYTATNTLGMLLDDGNSVGVEVVAQ